MTAGLRKGNALPSDLVSLRARAAALSLFKKERFLRSLTEDEFRDRVLRPLFLRLGFRDGRDLCGPTEEGKDALFLYPTPLGPSDVVVVQTKAGNLNLASQAKTNLENAVTQLRTAARTTVVHPETRQKSLPAKVLLCASGKINPAARKHIADEIRDPRLGFHDADDLIPHIDDKYPELWLGVEADVFPYLQELRRTIEEASEGGSIAELFPEGKGAATDSMFVDLHLWRNASTLKRRSGQVEKVPKIVEVPVTGLLKKKERRVLVLGDAGAGKSTALRRLAYVLAGRAIGATGQATIPVLLRATELARATGESLLEIVVKETLRISHGTKAPFSDSDLNEGHVAVFVDAFDEVAADHERSAVLTLLNTFHDEYPGCLLVLTSREHAHLRHLSELSAYARYHVKEISFRQAQQLVQRFEKKGSLPADTSKEIVRRLEQVHGMDLNPLLVTVFAATTEYARQDIPANITELFKKFTEMMLGRWDLSKGFAQQFHAPLKDFVLQKIAFQMQLERATSMPVVDFRARVQSELRQRGHEADIEALLDEVLTRSGLLRVVAERVEFRHLLIQEFFAGRGIPSSDLVTTLVFDDWWRRALVFYFGERPDNAEGLEILRQVVGSRSSFERFTAAGTLGLAVQACYLAPVEAKLASMREVIESLSIVEPDVVRLINGSERFPLSRFLTYYLYGRDCVALGLLDQFRETLTEEWSKTAVSKSERDVRTFWLVVGLMESGRIREAEELLQEYSPEDLRLLLAIHLGCYFIQHVRVVKSEERRAAERISKRVSESVGHLREQITQEFRTELLEMRRDEIVPIQSGEEPAAVGSDVTL